MAQGNKNPSPATRFKKGSCPNPGGKSKEQVSIERANAAKALAIRAKLLDSLGIVLDTFEGDDKEKAMKSATLIEASVLKLLKDAEDRGLGAPIQDVRSGDGSMTPPTRIEIVAVDGNPED